METKGMGWKEKHHLYHDRVIDLHFNHGWGYHRISQLVPVSKSGIRNWIANFVPEKENQYPTFMKGKAKGPTNQSSSEACDNRALQEKVASLERQLKKEKLRADAYDTMIDIAEKKFSIPIRKKVGAKQ